MSQQGFSVPFQGGYGCVTSPGLLCEEDNIDIVRADLSKIMTTENLEEEMKHVNEMKSIDKNGDYHIPPIKSCSPKISENEFQILTNECNLVKGIKKRSIEKNYKILQMQNGGQNWHEFPFKENLDLKSVRDFLISAYNVVRGVQDMQDKNFIHDDIKPANILYDIEKKRSNIIDFGISGSKEYIIKGRKEAFGHPFQWYDQGAPERFFHFVDIFEKNKSDFKIALKKSNYQHCIDWFKKQGVVKGFDVYYRLLNPEAGQSNEYDIGVLNEEIIDLLKMVRDLSHDDFLDAVLDKLDVYCIALSLVYVTFYFLKNIVQKKGRQHTSEDDETVNLLRSIRRLAVEATHVDPRKRPIPKQFAQGYENCVMSSVHPPSIIPFITHEDNLSRYKSCIQFRYPENSFWNEPMNSKSRSWVKDSEFVSPHEDTLKLDLIEFVKSGGFQGNTQLDAAVDGHWNIKQQSTIPLNIRAPQNQSRFSNDTSRAYFNLLGSLYAVCISSTQDEAVFNFWKDPTLCGDKDACNTPIILLDTPNANIYIGWKHKSIHTRVLLSLRTYKDSDSNDPRQTFSRDVIDKLGHFFLGDPMSEFSLAFITELLCLTLVEIYVPRNKLVTSIIGIICDERPVNATTNARQFEQILINMLSSLVETTKKEGFMRAYETRYKLSIFRDGIATSQSNRVQELRKYFNGEYFEKFALNRHRDHAILKKIQSELSSIEENILNEHATNQSRNFEKLFHLLGELYLDMGKEDVVFVYRGSNVTVDILKYLIKNGSDHTPLFFDVSYMYFSEDVTERINKTIKSSIENMKGKQKSRISGVYTQTQVDAMLLFPNEFDHELDKLARHLCQDTQKENTVYFIFEDRSKREPGIDDRYLLHGFFLREIKNKQNKQVPKEHELVILVPASCTFKVLEPITWLFVQGLQQRLEKILAKKIPFIKETNDMLLNDGSSAKKTYISLKHALFQADMISKKQIIGQATQISMDLWLKDQYFYVFKQMFFN